MAACACLHGDQQGFIFGSNDYLYRVSLLAVAKKQCQGKVASACSTEQNKNFIKRQNLRPARMPAVGKICSPQLKRSYPSQPIIDNACSPFLKALPLHSEATGSSSPFGFPHQLGAQDTHH